MKSAVHISEGFKRLSIVVGVLTSIGFFSFIAITEGINNEEWVIVIIVSLVLGIAALFTMLLIVWTIKWVIEGFSSPSSR